MVYWISLYTLRLFMKIFYRAKCYNRQNLSKRGPYIGIINHNSIFDIPAMAVVVNHKAATMVKDSLFKVPILRWWLRAVHMFPVRRDAGDQEAFEHALKLLKEGYVLYMAPEGTRKYDPNNPPRARTGFVRLAELADCAVVPIAFTGTREALPPGARFPRLTKVRANV
ncbi:MAG: 1-acyl-sn-glycerol-3-phosphate acyltransferase, partial [Calditrichaeota bacterium]